MTYLLFTSKFVICCPQKWVNRITVARNNAKQNEKSNNRNVKIAIAAPTTQNRLLIGTDDGKNKLASRELRCVKTLKNQSISKWCLPFCVSTEHNHRSQPSVVYVG